MSGLFDSILITAVDTVATEIYAPATDGVAMSILMTNGHFGTLPISVWIDRTGSIIKLASDVRVRAGKPQEILVGSKVALKAGDKIYATCPVAGAFTGVLSAYKDQ